MKIRKYFLLNDNENTTYQNSWGKKKMLRGKTIDLNVYTQKNKVESRCFEYLSQKIIMTK